jgi:hypothetical protein
MTPAGAPLNASATATSRKYSPDCLIAAQASPDRG